MTDIRRRIASAERAAELLAEVAELAAVPPVDLDAARETLRLAIEAQTGLPPGSLSRTPEQAWAKGFDNVYPEYAAALGLTMREFVELLKAKGERRL